MAGSVSQRPFRGQRRPRGARGCGCARGGSGGKGREEEQPGSELGATGPGEGESVE